MNQGIALSSCGHVEPVAPPGCCTPGIFHVIWYLLVVRVGRLGRLGKVKVAGVTSPCVL